MNIIEITNEMNAGGTITTAEYNFWMENYDAAEHPWSDPLADYAIDDSTWEDQLMDPQFEPSIEREGIAW